MLQAFKCVAQSRPNTGGGLRGGGGRGGSGGGRGNSGPSRPTYKRPNTGNSNAPRPSRPHQQTYQPRPLPQISEDGTGRRSGRQNSDDPLMNSDITCAVLQLEYPLLEAHPYASIHRSRVPALHNKATRDVLKFAAIWALHLSPSLVQV